MSSFKCLPSDHWIDVIETLAEMNEKSDHFADVSIHCKNKIILRAHRSVLASCSGFLAKLLSLEHSEESPLLQFVSITYDLICPDVEPEVMRKILQLIYTGSVNASKEEIEGMKSILESLQMDKLRQHLDLQHQPDVQSPPEVPEDERLINFYTNLDKENAGMLKSEHVIDENDPMADPIAVPKQRFYTCELCSATFLLKIALKKHSIQQHKFGNSRERKTSSTSNKIQQRVNKQKLTKECHLCPASFTRKADLMRHISWTHFKEELRKFCGNAKLECGVCNTVFTRETNLIRHLAYTHKLLDDLMLSSKGNRSLMHNQSVNEDVTNPEEFACLNCNARFALESRLRLHVAEVHLRPEVQSSESLQCGLCNQSFVAEADLLHHLLSAHQDSAKTELYDEEEMVFE